MNVLGNLSLTKGRKAVLRRKFILIGSLLAMAPLFFVSRAVFIGLAQIKDEKQKQITRVRYPFEPLEIVGLGNGQKSFAIGEKFEADRDWLKDFSIKFKNDTNKSIIYLAWQFDFPETSSTGNVMVSGNYYGVHPIRQPKEYENEPPIPPGGILEQKFDQKRFEHLKAFVEKRHKLDSLTLANIRVMEIRFSDGTGWNAGSLTKEDSAAPGRFVPIGPYRGGGNQNED